MGTNATPVRRLQVQRATEVCEYCGGERVITATASLWEFDWRCVWASRNPPPKFAVLTQGTLF